MAQEDDIAVVRSLFERFNEGDLDGAAALVTDDFELSDLAAGRTFHGPAGLREWLDLFRTALPDARTEVVNVLADGGRVASEHIGRGTHDGPFVTPAGSIPPTGRSVELRIGEFYELRDGRIARLSAYYDSATMLRQLGLMPAQGSTAEQAMTAMMGVGVKVAGVLRRG
jgi:steroid delta-isomerase-like uncharacterized protein